MTDSDIDTAAAAAKERGLTGKFLIALVNTSGQPALAVLTNRATRQRLMDASLNRDRPTNTAYLRPALGGDMALLRGMPNDVFFKVGMITIIGLSAKNAILIVEFARQLQAQGKGLVEATVEAARTWVVVMGQSRKRWRKAIL